MEQGARSPRWAGTTVVLAVVAGLGLVAGVVIGASRGSAVRAPGAGVETLLDVRLLEGVAPATVDELCGLVDDISSHQHFFNTPEMVRTAERVESVAGGDAAVFVELAQRMAAAGERLVREQETLDAPVARAEGLRMTIVVARLQLACAQEGAWP